MTLAEAMYAYLQTLSVGTRVYPRRLPKDAVLPAITFQVIPAVGPLKVHSDAHGGSGPVSGLFMRARMQWDMWGNTYLQAETLAREFRHAMHSFQGMMGDLYIGSVMLDIDMDSYDQNVDVYRRIIDGMVQYQETIA